MFKLAVDADYKLRINPVIDIVAKELGGGPYGGGRSKM